MTIFNNAYYDNLGLSLATPLKNPRIGYHNILLDADVAASSSAAGFEVAALLNPFTYEIWKPSTFPAYIYITPTYAETVDYLALGAHELGGCRITLESSNDGTTWTQILDTELTSNACAMILFEPVTASEFRLKIDNTESTLLFDFENDEYNYASAGGATGGASVSVMYLGQALAMPYCIYGGHTPGVLASRTSISSTDSEGGQWLGRSITRRGLATSFSFKNLGASWYRTHFQPFVQHARSKPFFIHWRPEGFATEAIYGKTQKDIEPSNQGVLDFMSVSVDVTGYSHA